MLPMWTPAKGVLVSYARFPVRDPCFPLWYYPLFAEEDTDATTTEEVVSVLEFSCQHMDHVRQTMPSLLCLWKCAYEIQFSRGFSGVAFGWLRVEGSAVVEWRETALASLYATTTVNESVRAQLDGKKCDKDGWMPKRHTLYFKNMPTARLKLLKGGCWNSDAIVYFHCPHWLRATNVRTGDHSVSAALPVPDRRTQNRMYDASRNVSKNVHFHACVNHTATALFVGAGLPVEASLLSERPSTVALSPRDVAENNFAIYRKYWNRRSTMFLQFFEVAKRGTGEKLFEDPRPVVQHMARMFQQHHGPSTICPDTIALWALVEAMPWEVLSWAEMTDDPFYFAHDTNVEKMLRLMLGQSLLIGTPCPGLRRCKLPSGGVDFVVGNLLTYMSTATHHRAFLCRLLHAKRDYYLHARARLDSGVALRLYDVDPNDRPPDRVAQLHLYENQGQPCSLVDLSTMVTNNPVLLQHCAEVRFSKGNRALEGAIIPATSGYLTIDELATRPLLTLCPMLSTCNLLMFADDKGEQGDRGQQVQVQMQLVLTEPSICLEDVLRFPALYVKSVASVVLVCGDTRRRYDDNDDNDDNDNDNNQSGLSVTFQSRSSLSAEDEYAGGGNARDALMLVSVPSQFSLTIGPSALVEYWNDTAGSAKFAVRGLTDFPTHYHVRMSTGWLQRVWLEWWWALMQTGSSFMEMVDDLQAMPPVACAMLFLTDSYPVSVSHAEVEVVGLIGDYYETTDRSILDSARNCLDSDGMFDHQEFEEFLAEEVDIAQAMVFPVTVECEDDRMFPHLKQLNCLSNQDPRLQFTRGLMEYLAKKIESEEEEAAAHISSGGKGSYFEKMLRGIVKVHDAYAKKLDDRRSALLKRRTIELVVRVQGGRCLFPDHTALVPCDYESAQWLNDVFFRFASIDREALAPTMCVSLFPDGTPSSRHIAGLTVPLFDYVHYDQQSMKAWRINTFDEPGRRLLDSNIGYVVRPTCVKTFVAEQGVRSKGHLVEDSSGRTYRFYNVQRPMRAGDAVNGQAMAQVEVLGVYMDSYKVVSVRKRTKSRTVDNRLFEDTVAKELVWEHQLSPYVLGEGSQYVSHEGFGGTVTGIEDGTITVNNHMDTRPVHLRSMKNTHPAIGVRVAGVEEVVVGRQQQHSLHLFALDSELKYALFGVRVDDEDNEDDEGALYRPSMVVAVTNFNSVVGTTLTRVKFRHTVSDSQYGLAESASVVIVPDGLLPLWQIHMVNKNSSSSKRARRSVDNFDNLTRFFAIKTVTTTLDNICVPVSQAERFKRRRSSMYRFEASVDSWEKVCLLLRACEWYDAAWTGNRFGFLHSDYYGSVVGDKQKTQRKWVFQEPSNFPSDDDDLCVLDTYSNDDTKDHDARFNELKSLWVVVYCIVTKLRGVVSASKSLREFQDQVFHTIWEPDYVSDSKFRHVKRCVNTIMAKSAEDDE